MHTPFVKPVTILALILVLLATACGALNPKPAALSNEEVRQLAESSLQALSSGDKEAFIQDFSDQMKAIYTDDQFENLRNLLAENSGAFVSCEGEPQLSNAQGYVRYSFPCKYEQEEVVVTFVFEIDGSLVEGLFFNSANLRKATQ